MRYDLRHLLAATAFVAGLLCLAVGHELEPRALLAVAFTLWTGAACWHTADGRRWQGVALEVLLVACAGVGTLLGWTGDATMGLTISAFAMTCALGGILASARLTQAPSPAPSRTPPPTAARSP